MELILSEKTVNTAYNALMCSRHTLKKQLKEKLKAIEIIQYQLAEVEDALQVFEELMELTY